MGQSTSLRLPLALFGGGLAVIGIAVLVGWWRPRMRPVLILGLDSMNWYTLGVFAAIVVALVGLGIAASRLSQRQRMGWIGLLLGALTFAAAIVVAIAALWAWVWSGISDRTEIALDDGRSIVVNARFWHHCDLTVLQRDGIFVDTVLGDAFDQLPCQAFATGDYTVVQRGDQVTLSAGGASLTVTLQP
jgi:hypothetical protein